MFHRSIFAFVVIATNLSTWLHYGNCQEVLKSTRFFRFDLIGDQEISREAFDLGEVHIGEEIAIQIYFVNYTERNVNVRPSTVVVPQVRLASEEITIAPNDGKLVFVTLSVTKKPKTLEQAISLECLLNKSARVFFSFNSKIVEVASFVTDELRYEFLESDLHPSRSTFSIPLLLSNNIGVKQLRSKCSEPLAFLTTEFRESNGMPILQVSFDSRDVIEFRVNGEISMGHVPPHTNSTLRLTLARKSDVDIYPKRIVLKPSKTSLSTFEGEAILKCRDANLDIVGLSWECETSGSEVIECRVEKMGVRVGRVYLSLKRTKESPQESNLALLFEASDGEKTRSVFASAYIAN